jgi:transposase
MKTFGLVIPAGKGSTFEANVRDRLGENSELANIIMPLLEAWRSIRLRAAELTQQLIGSARRSDACQLLMSIPGVGVVTASAFAAAVEDPANFRTSRSVGAWLGLTTRRYQSGQVDYNGHISRRGDHQVRNLLYEAASVILTRSTAQSTLRDWGLKLRERIGFKRAAVAVARKLAVIMHAMLKSGEFFERSVGTPA